MDIVIIIGILVTIFTSIPVFLQMKNHPKGLIICFMAEMWERFSYYGMRSLLIYYVTSHFLMKDNLANEQYASYTTLVYLLPLIGGVIGDRLLGTKKAIVFGGLLLVAGHFAMAIEGVPNQQTLIYNSHTYNFVHDKDPESKKMLLQIGDNKYSYEINKNGDFNIDGAKEIPNILPKSQYKIAVKSETPWAQDVFYLAISLIIMGVGFLKANISTIVGQLYKDHDPRRDAGFQLYYFGINLGAFWATILCGALGIRIGWWAGFGLAGIGMLFGLLIFVKGQKFLEGRGEPPNKEALKEKAFGPISKETATYIISILAIAIIYFVVQNNKLVGILLGIGSVSILAYVIYFMFTKLSKVENFRIGLALLLTLASVVFFTLFEQAGSSLSLFAERNTDMNILPSAINFSVFGQDIVFGSKEQIATLKIINPIWFNTEMTPAQTQSFNAGFILILAPIFSAIFTFLGNKNIDPDPVKKFAFGLINAGIGFLVLVWAKDSADSAFKLPLIFLFLTYLFHTIGELALSPVGLSEQTKLSPAFLASTMMAIWFMGSSWAQFVAGFIAKLATTETIGGQVIDASVALNNSLHTFKIIGNWGIVIGIITFILSFFVAKWAHSANNTSDRV